MTQEIKCLGFVKHLLDGVLCFLVRSKIFLASPVFSQLALKFSLPVPLKNFLLVILL